MVRRLFLLLLLLILAIPLSADAVIGGGGTFLAGGGSSNAGSFSDNLVSAYALSPYLSLSYSSSALKAEFKGSYTLSSGIIAAYYPQGLSLEKSYFRFRLPSFNGKKLQVTAGKAPVSWGMGYYYRAGDLLFDSPIQYAEAGKSEDRSLWIISLSQSLGGGFSGEAAFVFPFETDSGKERAGAKLSYDFQDSFLKELRAAYVYQKGNVHKASLNLDLSIWLDAMIGVESRFRDWSDFRLVVNLMKNYTIETEVSSHLLTAYISSEIDFYNKKYNLLAALSTGLTERTTLAFSSVTAFTDSGFASETGAASVEVLLADGVKLEGAVSAGYSRINDLVLILGYAGLEFAF